ncbi:MTOR-associated protein MEAK7-like isoform X2 [Rhodnius prolixus]|uniref:MTOR-associated protein MEAK7-like isoform X2 n=1 Tax=Rhodnius prolixus TaxID=13249 RepID=UPI003D18C0DD
MGHNSSKKHDRELFTEYEYTRLSQTFHINRSDLSSVNGDTFRERWSDYMVVPLMETWIQYFIRNEFHYQLKPTFDLERFAHLYKDQISPFIDVKSRGIIKIILGTDFSDRILGVNHARVVEYFRNVIISYMRCVEHENFYQFVKWKELGCSQFDHHQKQLVYHFVKDLSSTQGKVSELDLENWLREHTFVDKVLACLLDVCFSFQEYDQNFHPLMPSPLSSAKTILDLSHILFLTAYLTLEHKKFWTLIFSTRYHGFNFTKFSMAVKDVGPTLFIVKEKKGHLFGWFASESWIASPQFYGDNRCFIFKLSPNMQVYEASGYNSNYMYHNYNQQTIPNGFGMGGQIGFWGVWLDVNFGKGRCETFCSTFKNYHCPSKFSDFTFEILEAWAVDEVAVSKILLKLAHPTTF